MFLNSFDERSDGVHLAAVYYNTGRYRYMRAFNDLVHFCLPRSIKIMPFNRFQRCCCSINEVLEYNNNPRPLRVYAR